jgi:large subunit ribosomal protein L18
MQVVEIKTRRRERRKLSVRRRLRKRGTIVRLSVHRTLQHIYAQIVDESTGRTLCGVGTTAKSLAGELAGKRKAERAALIGKEIARLAKERGIEGVVFDRGHCRYHGRVKALAEAAREAGLRF